MQSDRQRLVGELLQSRHDVAAAQARFEALIEALASRVQTCFTDAAHLQRQGASTATAAQRAALPSCAPHSAPPSSPPSAPLRAAEEPSRAPLSLLPSPLPGEDAQCAAVSSGAARLPAAPQPTLCAVAPCAERSAPGADACVQDTPPPRTSGAACPTPAPAMTAPAAAPLTARLPVRTDPVAFGSGAASLSGFPSLLSPSRAVHRAPPPPPPGRGITALKPPAPRLEQEEEELSAAESDEAEGSGRFSEQLGERGPETVDAGGCSDPSGDEGGSEEASEEGQDAEMELDDEDDLEGDDDFEEDEEDEPSGSVGVPERPPQRLRSLDDLEVEERPRQKLMSLDDLPSD